MKQLNGGGGEKSDGGAGGGDVGVVAGSPLMFAARLDNSRAVAASQQMNCKLVLVRVSIEHVHVCALIHLYGFI